VRLGNPTLTTNSQCVFDPNSIPPNQTSQETCLVEAEAEAMEAEVVEEEEAIKPKDKRTNLR